MISYFLYQNYPNPFNPSTDIVYTLERPGFVTLQVYDVLGREVKNLVNESKAIGLYNVNFSGENFPSGNYFYVLNVISDEGEQKRLIKKMTLVNRNKMLSS